MMISLARSMENKGFIDHLKQLFAECDTDRNGCLAHDEFRELCQKIGLTDEAAQETFERLDIDQDGKITFEEFAVGFDQYSKQAAATSGTYNETTNSKNTLRPGSLSGSSSHSSIASANRPESRVSPVASRARRSPASPSGVLSFGTTGNEASFSPQSTSPVIGRIPSRFNDDKNGVLNGSQQGSPLTRRGAYSASPRDTQTSPSEQISHNGLNNESTSSLPTIDQNNPEVIVYSSDAIGDEFSNGGCSSQYGSLVSSSGAKSLNQLRNMQDLLDSVQKLQNENQILTQIFFKDKRQRDEYISQLGEEFDLQVREVEERANRRAKEELEAEKKSLREMMAAEREQLQQHYQTIEKMSQMIKSSSNKSGGHGEDGDCIDKVKSKLEDTSKENRQLKKSLLDTKSDVAMIWKEMERLKKNYEEKLSNAYERNNETKNEYDHIKRQLSLMKDSNRKLQDASDVLTTYIIDKVDPVIKSAGEDNLLSADANGGENESSRRGSILSEYLNDDHSKSDTSSDLSIGKPSESSISKDLVDDQIVVDSGSSKPEVPHLSNDSKSFDPVSDQTAKLTESKTNPRDEAKETNNQTDKQVTKPERVGALRNFGRNFFSTSKTRMDSKTDGAESEPDSKIERIGERKLNSFDVSSTVSDEPLVEPADGPSKSTLNIIMVGDSFVGKSSFAARFIEGTFVHGLISNCSIDFKTKAYKVDGVNYTINLWDTAGQERFRSITASYFRKANGIILMYDVTDKRSYLNVRNWMSTIADTAAENVAILLLGNKIDLRRSNNKDRCVPTEEGLRLAHEYGIIFLETSVKSGTNLIPSMGKLIRLIAKNSMPAEEDKDRIRLNDKSKMFNCMPKSC